MRASPPKGPLTLAVDPRQQMDMSGPVSIRVSRRSFAKVALRSVKAKTTGNPRKP